MLEIEEFYMGRLGDLVENSRFNDADAIFEEFVIDGEEPTEYLFISDMTNAL
jgi:hypothetical protein|tara:strand:- start:220 stop:375 length:156 start_codon:yes stop_codon:yes gene_type:complete